MIYFDTTYLVRCYFEDPGFLPVRTLAESDQVACSAMGRVELLSAFHRKLREKQIDGPRLRQVLRQFDEDESKEVWTWFPVSPAILTAAANRFRELSDHVFLRAADALHLSCAVEVGFAEIHSNDRHLLAASGAFGLQGLDVIRMPR